MVPVDIHYGRSSHCSRCRQHNKTMDSHKIRHYFWTNNCLRHEPLSRRYLWLDILTICKERLRLTPKLINYKISVLLALSVLSCSDIGRRIIKAAVGFRNSYWFTARDTRQACDYVESTILSIEETRRLPRGAFLASAAKATVKKSRVFS